MRNFSRMTKRWLNKGHEFDYIASLLMRKENAFYLVGNSKEIKVFYDRVGREINVDGRVKGVVLTEFHGNPLDEELEIVSDSDIPKDKNTIVICTSFDRGKYESVKQLFENYGFEENRQFFQAELISMIFEVYIKDWISLDRVEIFMTSMCSLKCEKCIAYIPYFKEKTIIPIETLKNDADILFEKVDYIRKYKVLGGEGLMYPQLSSFVEYVCSRYGAQIESFRIGTNGTIIPSAELLDVCRKHNVILDISDYTIKIGNVSKIEKVKQICQEVGVNVDIKRTGEQWLDMGFPKKLPGEKNEMQLQKHFSNCAMFCRNFNDGRLYYCCSNFAAVKAGLYPFNENDCFDFRRSFSKKELLEYEAGFSDRGYTTFCKVCRGCSDEVNPFHVEVAKQVERL